MDALERIAAGCIQDCLKEGKNPADYAIGVTWIHGTIIVPADQYGRQAKHSELPDEKPTHVDWFYLRDFTWEEVGYEGSGIVVQEVNRQNGVHLARQGNDRFPVEKTTCENGLVFNNLHGSLFGFFRFLHEGDEEKAREWARQNKKEFIVTRKPENDSE